MRVYLFFTFLFSALAGLCQTVPTAVKVRPPEVVAFNRNIETPVSMYTGVPDISIPLYEVNIKGVSVPIVLSYHAGGIRVDQDATWVGLGWSLSYGGEISRKSRGLPDEAYFFYGATSPENSINRFMQIPNVGSPNYDMMAQNERIEYIYSAKSGGKDYMPDEFYFSAVGYSGRYMFNQAQNKFVFYPKDDIHISYFNGPADQYGSPSKLYSWKMKLPNGVAVEFGKEGYAKQGMSVMNLQQMVTNSWQIKSLKNNYGDSIVYSYDNFDYRIPKLLGQQYQIYQSEPMSGNTMIEDPLIMDSRLREITFPGGRVVFITVGRQDLPTQALSEIVIYDNQNTLIKKISFDYSYFYGDAYDILNMTSSYYASRLPADYRYKRLKLDRVSFEATDMQAINYSFEYNASGVLPSKYSFAQDHWGFFNGINNNSLYGFIPNLNPRFAGGDRRVKADQAQVFSLKRITYPEGGSKEFLYEGNTAATTNVPTELLNSYQDDNLLEKSAAISISSYSRNTSYPSPDQTLNGVRYFRKIFTVSGTGSTINDNWNINTNFGISQIEQTSAYFVDNADFKLERINADQSRTFIKSFNTTHPDYPNNNAPPRKGEDKGWVNIAPGTYEMTVALTYLNQPNSVPDNQPYNLYFTIKWKELNELTKIVNVGGLRIKEIKAFDHNRTLTSKKTYSYLNPDAALPPYTSGRVVSFPQYGQNRLKYVPGQYTGSFNTEFSFRFSSNSVLPLETTSGSSAGYEFVTESIVDYTNAANTIRKENRFSFLQPNFSQFYSRKTLGLYEPKEWSRGKLLYTKYFRGNDIVRRDDYEYYFVSPYANNTETSEDYIEEINTDFISYQSFANQYPQSQSSVPEDFFDVSASISNNCVYYYYSPFNNHITTYTGYPNGGNSSNGISTSTCDYYTYVPYFKRYTGFDKLKSKVVTLYDQPANPIIQTENFAYERTPVHYQLTKTTASSSDQSAIITETKYPLDVTLSGNEETARLALVANHQLDIPLVKTKTQNAAQEITQTNFATTNSPNGLALPAEVKTNTAVGQSIETRSRFLRFDSKGNLQESETAAGAAKSVYLYSYQSQFPVAEINNADYNTVESLLGGFIAVQNFSNLINPDKAAIDAFLMPLRTSLPFALITTYTYKPLVGMTSSTDTKGMTTFYEYDAFQRLKTIKDQNGNILKQTDYHYKN